MAANFHVINFKNFIVGMLTGTYGSTSGIPMTRIRICTGAKPASVETALTGTVLADFSVSASTWKVATGGVAELVLPVQFTGVAAGTAGYARVSHQNFVLDLLDVDCGVTGGGADMELASTSIVTATNGNVMDGFSVKFPEAQGTTKYNVDLRSRLADILTGRSTTLPGLSQSGIISVYAGSQPSSPDAAPASAPLCTFSLSATASNNYNAPVGGIATLNGNKSSNAAVNAGTPTWARLVSSNGLFVMQDACGLSAAAFLIDRATISVSDVVVLTEATIGY